MAKDCHIHPVMCTTVNVCLGSVCHVKHTMASKPTSGALWDFCSSAHCRKHLQICVIRTLAFDENRAERAQRGLNLGALDAMSWPEYVWEYLYMHEDDLRNHRHDLFKTEYIIIALLLCGQPPHTRRLALLGGLACYFSSLFAPIWCIWKSQV